MSFEQDLRNHIADDWRTVHRIWDQVKTAIAAVKSSLWRDTTSNETGYMYIQSGETSCAAESDTTITFDVTFDAAPRVVVTGNSTNQNINTRVHTITASSFKVYLVNLTSGTACNVEWIAIGKYTR